MQPEKKPTPAQSGTGKSPAALAETERRRKEMERQNARRAQKPNLKTIPWKK